MKALRETLHRVVVTAQVDAAALSPLDRALTMLVMLDNHWDGLRVAMNHFADLLAPSIGGAVPSHSPFATGEAAKAASVQANPLLQLAEKMHDAGGKLAEKMQDLE